MALRFVPIALAALHLVASMPAITLQDLEVADDTVSVGSYVREVRAAPDNYNHESEGDGEIGYSRKKSGGGKKGYQHFDSYHKKAGDNYEFEKQDSYGLDDDGHDAAHSHRHEQKAKLRKPENSEDVEEIEGTHHREGHPEIEHEELKEGAPDGNGGVEAYGHDPKDYVVPEKYTYGEGDEYSY